MPAAASGHAMLSMLRSLFSCALRRHSRFIAASFAPRPWRIQKRHASATREKYAGHAARQRQALPPATPLPAPCRGISGRSLLACHVTPCIASRHAAHIVTKPRHCGEQEGAVTVIILLINIYCLSTQAGIVNFAN